MTRAPAAVFFILALAAGAAAQEKPPAPGAQVAPELKVHSEQSSTSSKTESAPEMKTRQGPVRMAPEVLEKLKKELSRRMADLPFNTLCYSMNSFMFARDNRGDAMRLVDHTTCTPATRFSLKKATVDTMR